MRLVATLLLFVSTIVSAQDQAPIRPATNADLPGYWRVVLLPDELHKLVKNETMGFSGPCRFLILKADGTWHNVSIANGAGDEETLRQCPTQRSAIDQLLTSLPPSKIRWNKHQFQDGFLFSRDISITDPNAIAGHLWKVDYVAEDFPSAKLFGFDLKKGEMIMQLTRSGGNNMVIPVWSMVLRPIQE